MGQKLKLAILGCGRLANIIVDAYNGGLLDDFEITAILGRNSNKANELAEKAGCKAFDNIKDLLATNPDYIAEAASVQAMKDYAVEILNTGTELVVLSIGSFADEDFYSSVKQAAIQNNTKVHLVSGAIGGYDIMRTITLMGQNDTKAKIVIKKPPVLFEGSPLYNEEMKVKNRIAFEGNATEAIKLLPTQVNVAVATALATIGPEKTGVTIESVKEMIDEEQFNIYAESEKAKVHIKIDSEPHTSAGWSVVAKLRNLASPIVF